MVIMYKPWGRIGQAVDSIGCVHTYRRVHESGRSVIAMRAVSDRRVHESGQ